MRLCFLFQAHNYHQFESLITQSFTMHSVLLQEMIDWQSHRRNVPLRCYRKTLKFPSSIIVRIFPESILFPCSCLSALSRRNRSNSSRLSLFLRTPIVCLPFFSSRPSNLTGGARHQIDQFSFSSRIVKIEEVTRR